MAHVLHYNINTVSVRTAFAQNNIQFDTFSLMDRGRKKVMAMGRVSIIDYDGDIKSLCTIETLADFPKSARTWKRHPRWKITASRCWRIQGRLCWLNRAGLRDVFLNCEIWQAIAGICLGRNCCSTKERKWCAPRSWNIERSGWSNRFRRWRGDH